jgi:hypothetical protein
MRNALEKGEKNRVSTDPTRTRERIAVAIVEFPTTRRITFA